MITYTEENLIDDARTLVSYFNIEKFDGVYGVPRGGVPLAAAMSAISGLPMVSKDKITDRTIIADDVIDSGTTRSRWPDNYFVSIHMKGSHWLDKTMAVHNKVDDWIEYFWEKNEGPIEDSLVRVLQYIGEDPKREGLVDTPKRIVKSWGKLFSGYDQKPEDILKTTFVDGACNEMVILKDIEFYSTCEHHMLPFLGKVSIGYIPDKKVVGISKLARLVEVFARRMQIQERLSSEIADSIMDVLDAKGVMVVIEAKHLCMTSRGVEKQNSVMITSAIRGVFEQRETRDEFLTLIK